MDSNQIRLKSHMTTIQKEFKIKCNLSTISDRLTPEVLAACGADNLCELFNNKPEQAASVAKKFWFSLPPTFENPLVEPKELRSREWIQQYSLKFMAFGHEIDKTKDGDEEAIEEVKPKIRFRPDGSMEVLKTKHTISDFVIIILNDKNRTVLKLWPFADSEDLPPRRPLSLYQPISKEEVSFYVSRIPAFPTQDLIKSELRLSMQRCHGLELNGNRAYHRSSPADRTAWQQPFRERERRAGREMPMKMDAHLVSWDYDNPPSKKFVDKHGQASKAGTSNHSNECKRTAPVASTGPALDWRVNPGVNIMAPSFSGSGQSTKQLNPSCASFRPQISAATQASTDSRPPVQVYEDMMIPLQSPVLQYRAPPKAKLQESGPARIENLTGTFDAQKRDPKQTRSFIEVPIISLEEITEPLLRADPEMFSFLSDSGSYRPFKSNQITGVNSILNKEGRNSGTDQWPKIQGKTLVVPERCATFGDGCYPYGTVTFITECYANRHPLHMPSEPVPSSLNRIAEHIRLSGPHIAESPRPSAISQ